MHCAHQSYFSNMQDTALSPSVNLTFEERWQAGQAEGQSLGLVFDSAVDGSNSSNNSPVLMRKVRVYHVVCYMSLLKACFTSPDH